MYEQILYEVGEPAALITLNRPKQLNAWTDRMAAEVKHAVAAAEADERVVAIVLTGAGRGFCSGADMNLLRDISEGKGAQEIPADLAAEPGDPSVGESFRGTYTYLMSVRKPVIAAINGPVAGMAVPIVAACDIRFASDQASFMAAFSKRGLIAEWGSSWLLPRLLGPAHALDLLFSSRKVDAREAERIGLVNRVVPHDELLPSTRRYVEDLAANCSPTSMMIMKRQVYQQLAAELSTAEKEAFGLMLDSFRRPDFREGVMAFLEKRPPKFSRIRKD
jgi:enoyl-CoA hydratase/carnithine racemase